MRFILGTFLELPQQSLVIMNSLSENSRRDYHAGKIRYLHKTKPTPSQVDANTCRIYTLHPSPCAEALQPNLEKSDPETPPLASTGPSSIPTSTADSPSSATLAAAAPIEIPTTNQPNPSPILYSNHATGLNQTPAIIPPPAPPAAPSFTPSYRLFGAPSAPQYTAVPNPNIQPPGVSAPMLSVNPMIPGTMYTAPPGMPPYGSNGYMSAPVHAQHAFPPPALPRTAILLPRDLNGGLAMKMSILIP
ncbi:hypothetical protein KSP40_PGU006974 [Platanthera guangdongensis]|uniref:Uncharacterized protein n=1 Tax=Platanthera guangdongensis TaxID=2320717 RepID=A0ABR2MFS4_9ASPA